MFGFLRKKEKETARLQQEYIMKTVSVFMEQQLKFTEVYECYPTTPGARAIAELLMVGAIDYTAQSAKAYGEAQLMAATANLLVPVFGYKGSRAGERTGVLLNAVWGESAKTAAYDIVQIGGERMREFMRAADAVDNEALRRVGSTLTNLLREERNIQI